MYISSLVWDQTPRLAQAGVPHYEVPLEEPRQIVLIDPFSTVTVALTIKCCTMSPSFLVYTTMVHAMSCGKPDIHVVNMSDPH